MQTVRLYDNEHYKIYRYGLKPEYESASWYSNGLGNDPYDRKRVIPQHEMYNIDKPLDKDFAISNGFVIYEWSHIYSGEERIDRIKRFFGIPKTVININLDIKLWCCFTMDGRIVLFKNGAKPIRQQNTLSKYTKTIEEWTNQMKQYGVRNPKYFVKYWQFKHEDDYLICCADDKTLFNLLPDLYEDKLRKMFQDIKENSVLTSCYNNYTDRISLKHKEKHLEILEKTVNEKNELLWNVEPFCLDDPCDYTESKKLYIDKMKRN